MGQASHEASLAAWVQAESQLLVKRGPSILQTLGKDRIIFVSKEDHETPSSAELVADNPEDPYKEHGLILPN